MRSDGRRLRHFKAKLWLEEQQLRTLGFCTRQSHGQRNELRNRWEFSYGRKMQIMGKIKVDRRLNAVKPA